MNDRQMNVDNMKIHRLRDLNPGDLIDLSGVYTLFYYSLTDALDRFSSAEQSYFKPDEGALIIISSLFDVSLSTELEQDHIVLLLSTKGTLGWVNSFDRSICYVVSQVSQ